MQGRKGETRSADAPFAYLPAGIALFLFIFPTDKRCLSCSSSAELIDAPALPVHPNRGGADVPAAGASPAPPEFWGEFTLFSHFQMFIPIPSASLTFFPAQLSDAAVQ